MKTPLLYLLPVWLTLHAATPERTPLPTPHSQQSLTAKKSFFRLGNRVMKLHSFQHTQDRPYVIISLHNNEQNLIEATKSFIAEGGGQLVVLDNEGKKNVEVELFDKKVAFDPSFIYTAEGRRATLKSNRSAAGYKYNEQLEQFARFITSELEDSKDIVEIHSHDDEAPSVKDFEKGGSKHREARKVYCHPSRNVSDFFMTPDEDIFNALEAAGQNVVLMSNHKLRSGGSLNHYCRQIKRNYVRLETKADHVAEQTAMLTVLDGVLKSF